MEKKPLSEIEISRLENIISSIAKFNYFNFLIGGISLVLSTLDDIVSFSLPIGNLEIPYKTTMIGFYLLSVALTLVTLKLFILALPGLKNDESRITFPWIGLNNGKIRFYSVFFWSIFPLVINCIPLAINYSQLNTGYLLFAGFLIVMSPTASKNYFGYLIDRKDDKADLTFSMWILYLIRFFRGLVIPLFFLSAILNEIPKWGSIAKGLMSISFITIIVITILRVIGPFTYNLFDRLGVKFGFSKVYPYKK